MDLKDKKYLTVGLFVLIASVGITYYIAEGDTAYYCEVENSVGLCFKLSKVNDAGLQTRCYYSEETPTKYNYCKSGWFVYEDPSVTGELIKVDDNLRIEKIDDKYYIYELKEITSIEELELEIIKLSNYEFDMEYCLSIDGLCDMDCQNSKEYPNYEMCVDICKENWIVHCESQEYFMNKYNQEEIERLNDKINNFKEIK